MGDRDRIRRAENPLSEQIEAGAIGLKLHEDWGTTPMAIDCALSVAEKYDIQVAIHTDTINEAGFVQESINAFKGRTIHTYHTEGAGGGHAPDIIRVCGEPNCLPSSTNPTMPFTVNTLDEHLDMLMVCHHLNPSIPEDVAFAESRIRGETIAAEDVLHDLGAISMMSSDSQAMGRIGEVVLRTWQTAKKMKSQRGPLSGEKEGSDNLRARRYVAKFTINPEITRRHLGWPLKLATDIFPSPSKARHSWFPTIPPWSSYWTGWVWLGNGAAQSSRPCRAAFCLYQSKGRNRGCNSH